MSKSVSQDELVTCPVLSTNLYTLNDVTVAEGSHCDAVLQSLLWSLMDYTQKSTNVMLTIYFTIHVSLFKIQDLLQQSLG